MKVILIDSEFKNLIPPLSAEERANLEESILNEGCRDALVLWGDTLIDGHNRYEICTAHNIPYNTIQMNFNDRLDVKEWIFKNQFGRRNLSEYSIYKLALEYKQVIQEKAKRKEAARKSIMQAEADKRAAEWKKRVENNINLQGRFSSIPEPGPIPHRRPDLVYFVLDCDRIKIGAASDTSLDNRVKDITKHVPSAVLIGTCEGGLTVEKKIHEALAEERINNEWFRVTSKSAAIIKAFLPEADFSNVGKVNSTLESANAYNLKKSNLAKFEKIQKKAPEELKSRLMSGDVSINEAYNAIKKEERRELIQKQVEDIERGNIEKPTGLFDVIAMDPPWNYGTAYSAEGRRVANPYPEMSLDELKALELPAKDNCTLFLWTTQQFLFAAKELLDHYGFTYRAVIVWDKEKIGMGDFIRMQCEFCLIGIKGKPIYKDNHAIRDIIHEPRREHSRKPEAFYQLVNDLCAGDKLDYFCREKREGWASYGNDTKKF